MAKTKTPRSAEAFPTLDEFLVGEGTHDAFQAVAIAEVRAWQIAQATKAQS